MKSSLTQELTFVDLHPAAGDLRDEVLAGLRGTPKALEPKLFYDLKKFRTFEVVEQLWRQGLGSTAQTCEYFVAQVTRSRVQVDESELLG